MPRQTCDEQQTRTGTSKHSWPNFRLMRPSPTQPDSRLHGWSWRPASRRIWGTECQIFENCRPGGGATRRATRPSHGATHRPTERLIHGATEARCNRHKPRPRRSHPTVSPKHTQPRDPHHLFLCRTHAPFPLIIHGFHEHTGNLTMETRQNALGIHQEKAREEPSRKSASIIPSSQLGPYQSATGTPEQTEGQEIQ